MEFAELIKTPKVDHVILHRPLHEPTQVVLCITSHHIILSARSSRDELWILHVMVDSVERRQSVHQNALIIKCKDFRIIQLDIPSKDELNNVADSINCLSNFDDPRLFYPFYHRPMFEIMEDGWQAFNHEYQKILKGSDLWRVSSANKGYSLCSSYPQRLIVPKTVSDESLAKVAQFRCLGRFPVLSYIHKPNGACIVRSGQPMVGSGNKRCKEDEKYLNTIIGNKRGYIIETRTQKVAQLAKANGGGYEPEIYYPLLRRVHRPIERYPNLAESLHKLMDVIQDKGCSTEQWWSRLNSSNWLQNKVDVLTCASLVAQCIAEEGATVLVHGSEGTDSTLQVSSLAQIILDPDCRTVQGFEALIEREWLEAGHPFGKRCKHGAWPPVRPGGMFNSAEYSPVFMLFLDCVWQLTQRFPLSFEFDEDFLILIFEHAYASEFGTFLANSSKEREEYQIPTRTTSLWSYINKPEILQKYINPFYRPNSDAIWPSVAPVSIELWESLFYRWNCDRTPKIKAKKHLHEIRVQQLERRSIMSR